MKRDRLPQEHSGAAQHTPATARDRSTLGRVAGLVLWVAAMGCLLPATGCSTISDPVAPPSQRLKAALNPFSAQAEEKAFQERVKKDPFPAASPQRG
jgi:hypothetical protein